MSRVRMVHPNLPGQEITVPELAEYGHRRSGWITPEEAATSAPDETESAPEPVATSRSTPEPTKPAATARRTNPLSGQDKE